MSCVTGLGHLIGTVLSVKCHQAARFGNSWPMALAQRSVASASGFSGSPSIMLKDISMVGTPPQSLQDPCSSWTLDLADRPNTALAAMAAMTKNPQSLPTVRPQPPSVARSLSASASSHSALLSQASSDASDARLQEQSLAQTAVGLDETILLVSRQQRMRHKRPHHGLPPKAGCDRDLQFSG